MKNLGLTVLVMLSIGLGIWLGLQSGSSSIQTADKGYPDLGGDFTLQSDQGEVSLSDFKGKVVPIYFGFTHCPDVCITSLSKIAQAIKALPEGQRTEIQPLFITLDPERDDAQKSAEYARYFHPSMIGLSGSPQEINDIAKRYFVAYEKVQAEDSAMGYTIDHSSIIYLVGRDGVVKTLVHHADTAEALVQYLKDAL
jgi:protein SCO1/2